MFLVIAGAIQVLIGLWFLCGAIRESCRERDVAAAGSLWKSSVCLIALGLLCFSCL